MLLPHDAIVRQRGVGLGALDVTGGSDYLYDSLGEAFAAARLYRVASNQENGRR